MSFGLPEEGDLDWAPPVNDSIEATRSDAATAKADAASARATAIEARAYAQSVNEFVEAPTAERMATIDADAASAVRVQQDARLNASIADAAPARVTPTKHAPGFGLYFIEAEGGVGDGSHNDSAAFLAAATAAMAGGGRVRMLAGKTYRCDDQLAIPYTGTTPPRQNSLIIEGSGRFTSGYGGNISEVGGSRLDLRYSGGGSNLAKIDTRGFGYLELRDFTLTDLGTSSNPFFKASSTTVNIHDLTVIGNPTKSTATCDQDVFILGGMNAPSGPDYDLTADGPFQGYGSRISNVQFYRIRRGVLLGNYANSVFFDKLTAGHNCGNTGGAFFEADCNAQNIYGLGVTDLLIETPGYKYAVKLRKVVHSHFRNVSAYDPGASFLGTFYLDTCSALHIHAGFSSFATHPYIIAATGLWQDQATLVHGGGNVAGNPGTSIESPLSAWNGLTVRAAGGGALDQIFFARSLDATTGDQVTLSNFGRRWGFRTGTGTDMEWNTGTGGSYAKVIAFALRLYDHTGTLRCTLGKSLDGMRMGASEDVSIFRTGSVTPTLTAGNPFQLPSFTTALRPNPLAMSEGVLSWDTTLKKVVVADGATSGLVLTGPGATATLDFPSIAAAGQQELTITVTGAAVGDCVAIGPPASLEAGLQATAYVSATNTVKIRLSNVTGSAIDPASASWSARIVR